MILAAMSAFCIAAARHAGEQGDKDTAIFLLAMGWVLFMFALIASPDEPEDKK
jgi:hypothetical protein